MYFDNNANIPMTSNILSAYGQGAKLGNISNESKNAKIGQKCRMELVNYLKNLFPGFEVVLNSGGSESNSTIIRNFEHNHMICGTTEHSSITEIVKDLNVSWVYPKFTGHIPIAEIAKNINGNTKLIFLQSINSETGAIQNLPELVNLLPSGMALHIDHVQGFLKHKLQIANRKDLHISISVSFHKIGAPIGFGALITNYKYMPLIGGTQNGGMRGGTYNAPAILATIRAIKDYNYAKIIKLRAHFDQLINNHFVVKSISDFLALLEKGQINGSYIVIFSCNGCLPHTIFMSIGKNNIIYCNKVIKSFLQEKNITIGYGSACSNEKKKDFDDIGSMASCKDIPRELKNGFIRISLSCYNKKNEINYLVNALKEFS